MGYAWECQIGLAMQIHLANHFQARLSSLKFRFCVYDILQVSLNFLVVRLGFQDHYNAGITRRGGTIVPIGDLDSRRQRVFALVWAFIFPIVKDYVGRQLQFTACNDTLLYSLSLFAFSTKLVGKGRFQKKNLVKRLVIGWGGHPEPNSIFERRKKGFSGTT